MNRGLFMRGVTFIALSALWSCGCGRRAPKPVPEPERCQELIEALQDFYDAPKWAAAQTDLREIAGSCVETMARAIGELEPAHAGFVISSLPRDSEPPRAIRKAIVLRLQATHNLTFVSAAAQLLHGATGEMDVEEADAVLFQLRGGHDNALPAVLRLIAKRGRALEARFRLLLADEREDVRGVAVRALGTLPALERESERLLRAVLEDPSAVVRMLGSGLLMRLGEEDEEAPRSVLRAAIRDPESHGGVWQVLVGVRLAGASATSVKHDLRELQARVQQSGRSREADYLASAIKSLDR